jgi:uncharacterized protein (UPF0335 family)
MAEREAMVAAKPAKDRSDYLAFKERSKQKSRLKKEIAKTTERVELLEKEIENLAEQIGEAGESNDWQNWQSLTDRKSTLEEETLELVEKLEALEEEQKQFDD